MGNRIYFNGCGNGGYSYEVDKDYNTIEGTTRKENQKAITDYRNRHKKNNKEEDIRILKALYCGNHLNEFELTRVEKLLFMLNVEFKNRI